MSKKSNDMLLEIEDKCSKLRELISENNDVSEYVDMMFEDICNIQIFMHEILNNILGHVDT